MNRRKQHLKNQYKKKVWILLQYLFGKSTHISMISNSVTHLRSYTNSAIADIAGNSARAPMSPCRSPMSPRRSPMSPHRAPIANVSTSSADIVASNGGVRVFCDVLRVFHNVLLVVRDVLRRFTMYHNVLQVFYDVLRCIVSRATIGIAASATTRPPIAAGIGDNSAGIGDDAAGIGDNSAKVLSRKCNNAQLRPNWSQE